MKESLTKASLKRNDKDISNYSFLIILTRDCGDFDYESET